MACPRRRRGGGGPLALLPSPCGKCRGQDPACLLEEGLSEAISPTPPGRGVDGCLVRHLRMHVGSNTHPNLARPGRQSPSNLRLWGKSTCEAFPKPWLVDIFNSVLHGIPLLLFFSPRLFTPVLPPSCCLSCLLSWTLTASVS